MINFISLFVCAFSFHLCTCFRLPVSPSNPYQSLSELPLVFLLSGREKTTGNSASHLSFYSPDVSKRDRGRSGRGATQSCSLSATASLTPHTHTRSNPVTCLYSPIHTHILVIYEFRGIGISPHVVAPSPTFSHRVSAFSHHGL